MGKRETLLGLDLGVSSAGWALVELDDDLPVGIKALGSRIFDPGMDGDFEFGREESRNKTRREKRQIRRQAERRARRQRRVAGCLMKFGLLPTGRYRSSGERHDYFAALDREIAARWADTIPEEARHRFMNAVPFWLRAAALGGRLDPEELGRAIYHLSQHRGFLSNRKMGNPDEEGVVKKQISGLAEEMGDKTLAEFFIERDPTAADGPRIRGHYTSRQMHLDEFDRIWESQQEHHPQLLTEEARAAIHRAIFYQRKLKSSKSLIGICTYERRDRGCPADLKRAPRALLITQRFRMLQTLNNLRYRGNDDEWTELAAEQREILAAKLDLGDMTWTQARKALGLRAKPKQFFNFEEGGEKKLFGNRTAEQMRGVFGEELWDTLSPEQQDQAVEDVLSYEKSDALEKRGRNHWKLPPEQAQAFAAIRLEPDYGSLSRKAMETLLPYMEQGERYDEAALNVYGELVDKEAHDLLPPVFDALGDTIRNPTVIRTLTQTRKVVNAIIKQHGKPDRIYIELARDAKRSKKERNKLAKKNKKLRDYRDDARDALRKEELSAQPTGRDVEKYRLWKECEETCPYTGKHISFNALFGPSPQFDVEHIIPYSRSLDNSYLNKTLCDHEVNRTRKRNKAPQEVFSEEELQTMVQRVKRFTGDPYVVEAKLKRFRMSGEELEQYFSDFPSSHLGDTRYASVLARDFCRFLYGDDATRVRTTKGFITAQLRRIWDLNRLLGEGDNKDRADHRHHAIDALVTALSTPKLVGHVTREAQRLSEEKGKQRWWKDIEGPWEGFLDDARKAIDECVVSVQVDKRVRGALHEESLYGNPRLSEDGKPGNHIRKRLDALSKSEVKAIVDPVVRQKVEEQLHHLGGDPAKVFSNPENHPYFISESGRKIAIASAPSPCR